MKVPPKRKGNPWEITHTEGVQRLNESPSEKEGKLSRNGVFSGGVFGLNESPSEKEGKFFSTIYEVIIITIASMKVPPKRKGNLWVCTCPRQRTCLNESPSEKEGKSLLKMRSTRS